MTSKLRCWFANTLGVLGAVAVVALTTLYITVRHSTVPAQVITEMHVESPIVPQGGKLVVMYHVTRNEECQAVINRYILQENNDAVEWSTIGPPLITKVGREQPGTTVLKLPDYISPGRYRYRAITFNSCGTHTFIASSPDLPFTIIPMRK